jgi:TDG/mug DNA glycosylase family protein
MRSSEGIGARIGAVDGVHARDNRPVFDDPVPERLPLALADLQLVTPVGAGVRFRVPCAFDESRVARLVAGAGFAIGHLAAGKEWLDVDATRLRTLPDTVGAGMHTLLVGLNPSVYSADRGVGFARPGNRFWPAALAAGLVTRDRDPRDALLVDGVGMTDLVKRATARADELSAAEYRSGAARVEALVDWLAPGSVCFVGLSGYRVVADRKAQTGWQARRFGGRPAYVMPNPSGINAHATPAALAAHLTELRLGRS